MSPADSPSPREGAAIAYDAAAGNMVLFGGSSTAPLKGGSTLGDTWTWDGANWTLQSPALSPPARAWSNMAYVPATKTLVMFGGANWPDSPGAFSDTWTWDGIAKTWKHENTAVHPSARASNQLVYDRANRNVVLYGGVTMNLTNLDDTWTWDGMSWTQHFPAVSPEPRNGPSLAYDAGLQAVVLFGGAVGPCCSNNRNDTWAWDGTNWKELSPAIGALPHARNAANMDYYPPLKSLLLFGGSTGAAGTNSVLGDTWLFALAP